MVFQRILDDSEKENLEYGIYLRKEWLPLLFSQFFSQGLTNLSIKRKFPEKIQGLFKNAFGKSAWSVPYGKAPQDIL